MSAGPAGLNLDGLTSALGAVLAERMRQVCEHGWTPEKDDSRDRRSWAWLIEARAHQLAVPYDDAVLDERRQLVEVAAIAVAAIEAHDRRQTANDQGASQ